MGWNIVSEELGEFIEILPPQKRVGEHWYLGTADAVYQNLYSHPAREPAARHRPRRATTSTRWTTRRCSGSTWSGAPRRRWPRIEVPVSEAHRFGIIAVDESERVIGFQEKPASPPTMPGRRRTCALASMGVYIFETDTLDRRRSKPTRPADTSHDFGKDIIPALYPARPVYSYRFYDENKKAAKYWRDIGTIDAYYEANMDLCHVNPEFNLYDPEWPMRTHQPQAPPAKFVFAEDGTRCGQALDSIISSGCIISGSRISGSVLCPNVRVHSFCTIENSILMPGVRVGRHARIRKAIIDRDVLIPRGAVIGYDAEEDRRRHTVSDGGVVVVTVDDEPLIGPIDERALAAENEADRKGQTTV